MARNIQLEEEETSISSRPHPHEREEYIYEAPWGIAAINWSVRPDHPFRLGICSELVNQDETYVEILKLDRNRDNYVSDGKLSIQDLRHPSKIMFVPDRSCQMKDLFATSGTCLRVWHIQREKIEDKVEAENIFQTPDPDCGPITCLDWNELQPSWIGTGSTDRTCTIWDIERSERISQIIAHENEVADIAWGAAQVYASISNDGSFRVVDLRDMDGPITNKLWKRDESSFGHVAWNKNISYYIAISSKSSVLILDTRAVRNPILDLWKQPEQNVNAIAWAPHLERSLCSAGDDRQASIWEIQADYEKQLPAKLLYNANTEIAQLQWSSCQPDWVAVAYSTKLSENAALTNNLLTIFKVPSL
ncbi:hypothetical protein O6H91_06G010900 [Diphasiastrum complanatum]|uniref:Uncharacterized protein n=1 Tax=Diphasiastrum complanatum TaxID=34168 RepID=A0ACC2DB26_DIPCM|nr:hypothetical protein O6H91_Y069700 [Diphasiastrum complanatum]KAJ7297987.1 hypothetical protein O6H91_Y024000 [Diphasiastrum complanatum]KAJ7551332.1 hypothetical protein O6H91_06G010900 [Diphasiastrum complanatum]